MAMGFKLMRVNGHSMAPALHPGELILVRQGALGAFKRGDIVAARPEAFGGRAFVKRLAGLPHEAVERDGQTWQLGPDEFFLMGDRTDHSMDSRRFGPVTFSEILGRVQFRLWPRPSRIPS